MNQKELLQMVKDGVINVDDAIKLMEAADVPSETTVTQPANTQQGGVKMLKVIVDANENGKTSKVRVNIPTTFLKLAAMSGKKMDINGVNLGEMVDIDMIMNAIDDGVLGEIVNIESDEANVVVIIE